MPRAVRSICLCLLLLAVAGCAAPGPATSPTGSSAGASSPPVGPSGSGGAPSAAGGEATKVAFAGAPGAVALRESLPLCGVEDSGGAMNAPNVAFRRCFLDAFLAGRPAELVSKLTTIEGDPITVIYRTRPGQPIEVFWDNTRDKFGSGAWETYGCGGLHEIKAGDPSGMAVTEVFVLDQCTEARQIR